MNEKSVECCGNEGHLLLLHFSWWKIGRLGEREMKRKDISPRFWSASTGGLCYLVCV